MIKHLQIKNFKSIKELEFDCARVNIFIGEPNTGKSNIIEAIGMQSVIHNPTGKNKYNRLYDYVRAEKTSNLFYFNIIDEPIIINTKSTNDEYDFTLVYDKKEYIVTCKSNTYDKKWIEAHIDENFKNKSSNFKNFQYNQVLPVRFYKYKKLDSFYGEEKDFLTPPWGENLQELIRTRQKIKNFVSDLFKQYGYVYQGFDDTKRIYLNIPYENEFVPIPFNLLSDTLLRLIFYYAAIELSNEAVLILEEPETHVFPFYNEQLALMIANNSNQFFIATHNPYFLNMLINKTPAEQLHVFKVTYKDYQTHAKLISKDTLQKFVINDNDILLNIDRLDEDI